MSVVGSAQLEALQALLVVLLTVIVATTSIPRARLSFGELYTAIRQADGRCGPRRSHTAAYSRDWYNKAMTVMSESDFARTFRVPRAVFTALVYAAEVSVFFAAPEYKHALPVMLQVAMGLYKCVPYAVAGRFLSGPLLHRPPLLARALRRIARPISYFDLAQKFGVSESSAHKSVNCRFVKWIIATYMKAQLLDRWPRTPQKCAEMAGAFTLSHSHISGGKNVIRGCIGALDGTLVPIWCKDFLQKLYYCRKGACTRASPGFARRTLPPVTA